MNYLFISAHTDDAEFGAGATISRLVEEGNTINVIAFSYCGNKELKDEMRMSCNKLGVNGVILAMNNKVRLFSEVRQGILEVMIGIKKDIDIDTVFTFSKHDIHQDHKVIYEETLRAFKHKTIYGYSFPQNCFSFSSDSFFKVEKKHLDNKIKALQQYKSQRYRLYMSPEFIKSNAIYRGLQAGCKYAECFEVIRQII
ncbi:hypothetical protein LCGC14_1074410 [marine sediment metagenome]|uniref:LmbE family protein n=1 Tax=marine sediment metagenome TaxID=412755 RepID=A0A0F9MLW1_9ZZZZ